MKNNEQCCFLHDKIFIGQSKSSFAPFFWRWCVHRGLKTKIAAANCMEYFITAGLYLSLSTSWAELTLTYLNLEHKKTSKHYFSDSSSAAIFVRTFIKKVCQHRSCWMEKMFFLSFLTFASIHTSKRSKNILGQFSCRRFYSWKSLRWLMINTYWAYQLNRRFEVLNVNLN